jgi:tRNA-specific 2-thiouridylase
MDNSRMVAIRTLKRVLIIVLPLGSILYLIDTFCQTGQSPRARIGGAGVSQRTDVSVILKAMRKGQKTSRSKVVVAMSGGVDSSVAAFLLVEKGYDVTGITMNLYSLPKELCRSEELRSCCGRKAIEDAHRVAIHLGIPHFVVDLRQEFKAEVIADFALEYGRGRTPNPCIRCNERIKFGLLLQRAGRLGANFIATGHHARVAKDTACGRFLLKKGRDAAKDQSYFLYRLNQAQLSMVLMPVGDFTKAEVREIARRRGLPVAEKAESQETCFAPRGDYPEFLAGRAPGAFRPGPIKDLAGGVLGEHRGIGNYTIGQRRGLGISAPRPLYVVAIDARRNAVIVGEEKDLYCRRLLASEIRLVSGERLEESVIVRAKIRYKHREAKALVIPVSPRRGRVEFDRPQRAITPGQSIVFYRRDVVIGGGIIDRTLD